MTPILPNIHGVDTSLYIELPAIAVGGLSGGAHAKERGFDYMGVIVLAIASGLGGGMLRDMILGLGPPLALRDTRYLATVSGAAAVSYLFSRRLNRVKAPLVLIDALALGFFAIAGVDRAISVGLPAPGAAVLGVVAAVGGSVIRDLLANETPSLVLPGELYATSAALGVVAFLVMVWPLHVPRSLAAPVAVGVTFLFRIASTRFGWRSVGPRELGGG
jgi:uncharacterized membrane protein YeiH